MLYKHYHSRPTVDNPFKLFNTETHTARTLKDVYPSSTNLPFGYELAHRTKKTTEKCGRYCEKGWKPWLKKDSNK